MNFVTPPENQGQIVDVSYAITEQGVVERRHDRSDGRTSYRFAKYTPALERWADRTGPSYRSPPSARWRRLMSTELARLSRAAY